ncbi:MAG: hypothetical protein QOF28_2827 [Actinomycetota bacterium]|nr:hypothetical protein [Actinomycetota bacterium]
MLAARMQPTRRAFLGLLAGAAASIAIVGFEITRHVASTDTPFRLDVIRRVLGDPAPARRIGAVYLAQVPSAASGRHDYVFPPLDPSKFPGGEAAMAREESLDLAMRVQNASHLDSFLGHFVQIDGWLLPQTICDLCAVANRQLS